ncbi:sensor histidine kinase [Haloimpatiens sp. FM7330]|uniref:sensor histidine kinase n=1 Tax=Haloimpatiens sp. FM7330 TaxID=3298610 RepID=UPI00362BDCCD
MKLKEYLQDKKFLFLFFFILMGFISTVIYLDNTVKVSIDNILYINFVSFIFFLLYLFGEYFSHNKYYKSMNYLMKNETENIVNTLPSPKTNEQELYHKLISNIYEDQNNKIDNLYKEKKDNLEFITSWVHEIKTPIAVSRLIIENNLANIEDNTLNSLEEEIDKIDNYVEQALYHSKIDSFSKDYFINEINLERIVKDLVKKHAKTFINKKIQIQMEDINLNITSDKKWITFIINQILSNSLKYTDEGGKIKFSTKKNNKEKILIIEDNGVGIRQEDIGRVFHKGFTGYNGRKNSKSTGMGLYLAKKLSRKLGHDISIESSYNEYTKAKIHFPKLTDYFNVANK